MPPKAKKYVRIFSFILLIGLVLSSLTFAFSYGISGWNEFSKRTSTRQININGEGKVATKPDIALFNASIVTEAKKIKDTQDENGRKSEAVTKFLKEKGVEEKDIKTIGYSIYPQYQYYDALPCYVPPCPAPRQPEIISYQVRHTLEIKVRDLNKVDELLEGIVSKGANEVGSVSFTIDEPENVKVEARKKAIENAQEKAEMLAKNLGVGLGKVVTFSESFGGYPVMESSARFYGVGGAGMGGGYTSGVQTGEQEVVANVNITYELR